MSLSNRRVADRVTQHSAAAQIDRACLAEDRNLSGSQLRGVVDKSYVDPGVAAPAIGSNHAASGHRTPLGSAEEDTTRLLLT